MKTIYTIVLDAPEGSPTDPVLQDVFGCINQNIEDTVLRSQILIYEVRNYANRPKDSLYLTFQKEGDTPCP